MDDLSISYVASISNWLIRIHFIYTYQLQEGNKERGSFVESTSIGLHPRYPTQRIYVYSLCVPIPKVILHNIMNICTYINVLNLRT